MAKGGKVFGLASLLCSHSSPCLCALRSWFWAPSLRKQEEACLRALYAGVIWGLPQLPAHTAEPTQPPVCCPPHSPCSSLLKAWETACSIWPACVGVKPRLSTAHFPGRKSFQSRQAFPTFNAPSLNLFHLGPRQCGFQPCLHSLQMDDPW